MQCKQSYDVIVVGAGPTGATAANILAKKGFSVLLVERCMLPRYKSCSGMVIAKSVDLVNKYFNIQIPDSVKCTPYDNFGMVFVNDDGKEYKFEQRGFNVWRSSFDNLLTSVAVKNGANLIDGVSVIECKEFGDYVEVQFSDKSIDKIRAQYLIDCEGAQGTLKRSFINSDKDYITTYQAFYEGKINLDPHYFYAYLQPQYSEYDAWFNVKDDMLVLGVAAVEIEKIKTYNKSFIKYMQDNFGLQINKKIKEEKWIMPRVRRNFAIDYGIGRVYFAGEVAGFLNPMGEGISCGMESGYNIAMAIANNFGDSQNILSEYKHNSIDLYNYMKRQWNLVSIMSKKFSHMNNK